MYTVLQTQGRRYYAVLSNSSPGIKAAVVVLLQSEDLNYCIAACIRNTSDNIHAQ